MHKLEEYISINLLKVFENSSYKVQRCVDLEALISGAMRQQLQQKCSNYEII